MADQSSREQPGHPPPRRERQQPISSLQIVFATILSIGLLLVINLSGRIARGQQMETERQRLQATIDVLESQKRTLLLQRDYALHDAAVEQWAHSEGKMVRDGEVLVIPIPAGYTDPTPTPLPPPALVEIGAQEPETPRWRLWWSLFFDGEPPF